MVERSGGPCHQFDHVPSSRRRARISFASLRSVARSRSPSTWSQKRCSAVIVAFDSSSPTHQPSASWSSRRRRVPASIVRSRVVGSAAMLMPAPPRVAVSARVPRQGRSRTAPSIVAGQPVSVHAPARTTWERSVSAAGRVTPGRSASVASGSRLTRDQTRSAWPKRSTSCPATRSTSSRPRISISSGTPLDTTVKY